MLVPFSVVVLIGCAGVILGALLMATFLSKPTVVPDLRAEILALAEQAALWEEPRLLEWTPELRARFRYQHEASRQMRAARRIA
jgi:hypothetical protein